MNKEEVQARLDMLIKKFGEVILEERNLEQALNKLKEYKPNLEGAIMEAKNTLSILQKEELVKKESGDKQ